MAQGVMYLTMKIIAVFAITFMRLQADAEKGMVLISALAFSCYFLFQFLMAREHRKRNIIFAGFAAAGCFFGLVEQQLPLLLVIVVELIDYLSDGQMLYQLSIIAGLILLFVFSAQDGGLLVSILVFGFTLFMRNMVKHIQILKEQNLKQKGQIQELRKKVMDLNTYTKTLCQTTAMEERKRFAARIHDQLGHGISGSILLLEGAKLQMDDNPALAKETISKATDNLRAGVESIRMSLREERPDQFQIGVGEIKAALERFQVEYNIETKLVTEGNLSRIPPAVWICAKENLTESLTNVLKHSNADTFTLKIQDFAQMIRLEYRDNGRVEKPFVKGMGTESMEERTILAGGKCLFSSGENGFCITNIFMKEGEAYGAQNQNSIG